MLGFSPISCQNTLGQPHYYLPQHVEKKWKSWRAPAVACLLTQFETVDASMSQGAQTPSHRSTKLSPPSISTKITPTSQPLQESGRNGDN